MATVFISYRREDSAGHAGRLHDRLRQVVGAPNIFMDVDTLKPGDDFVDAIESILAKCDVMLVLIGQRWLSSRDDGRSRLFDEDDLVRVEVETALQRRN